MILDKKPSAKSLHKKKIREIRLKNLEQRLKSNITKRKKNLVNKKNG